MGGSVCAEPTALTCLAMRAHQVEANRWVHGLGSLARMQRSDGSIPVAGHVPSPGWPTGLAVLAWALANPDSPVAYADPIARAVGWLVKTEGAELSPRPDVFGHDRTLKGWGWADQTHSWVEPTAYGVLALRAVGRAEHARVREGVRLLRDRGFSDGGWNYGNTRVFSNTLRPFPATTGIALAALAGEPKNAQVEPSLRYLFKEMTHVRSPFSLGWGLIGLTSWGARPPEADTWVGEAAAASTARAMNTLEDALLLLAAGLSGPLTSERKGDSDG